MVAMTLFRLYWMLPNTIVVISPLFQRRTKEIWL